MVGVPDVMVKSSLLDVFDAPNRCLSFSAKRIQSPDGRLWFANESVVR